MKDLEKPHNEKEAIDMLHRYNEDVLPKKFGKVGMAWVAFLCIVIVVGLYNYVQQLIHGLSVTALTDTVSWGIYISNFVFFVAISLVGSLITAVLHLLNVKWRAPLTRISEVIAVSAIVFAGLIIIVDMGRPDRLLNMFIYGRIQSPIVWDVIVEVPVIVVVVNGLIIVVPYVVVV